MTSSARPGRWAAPGPTPTTCASRSSPGPGTCWPRNARTRSQAPRPDPSREVASALPGQNTVRAKVNEIDASGHATTAGLPDLVRAAQGGNSLALAELLD